MRTLRRLRRAKGLTQTAVAKAVEISQPYVSAVESGRKVPSLPVINRWLGSLDATDKERAQVMAELASPVEAAA